MAARIGDRHEHEGHNEEERGAREHGIRLFYWTEGIDKPQFFPKSRFLGAKQILDKVSGKARAGQSRGALVKNEANVRCEALRHCVVVSEFSC